MIDGKPNRKLLAQPTEQNSQGHSPWKARFPLRSETIKGNKGIYTVDTRNLAKGIYIYVLATTEGKTINGKITIK